MWQNLRISERYASVIVRMPVGRPTIARMMLQIVRFNRLSQNCLGLQFPCNFSD
jgi:hypothetical protein